MFPDNNNPNFDQILLIHHHPDIDPDQYQALHHQQMKNSINFHITWLFYKATIGDPDFIVYDLSRDSGKCSIDLRQNCLEILDELAHDRNYRSK